MNLTPEQLKRLIRAVNATANSVCEGQEEVELEEFLEVMFDAGRLRMHGAGTQAQAEWEKEYDEQLAPWIKEHFGSKEFYRVLKPHFSAKSYAI